SEATTEMPTGFLFLCPTEKNRPGQSSFYWPGCPAYWSFDPSGVDHLTTEEADEHGFPEIQFSTQVWVESWDASVYAGLREFHQAKGFDPYGQDIARHLGHSLYQLSTDVDPQFAHSESVRTEIFACIGD
ncbi:hypothetical protein DFH06DRAFT_1015662, partial [Mycena polygramma]